MDDLGTRILAARRSQHPRITQAQLAAQLGVSTRQVGRWERGERTINVDQLRQVAAVCGVKLSDLLPELAGAAA